MHLYAVYCKLYMHLYIVYCKLYMHLYTVYCKLYMHLYTVYCKLYMQYIASFIRIYIQYIASFICMYIQYIASFICIYIYLQTRCGMEGALTVWCTVRHFLGQTEQNREQPRGVSVTRTLAVLNSYQIRKSSLEPTRSTVRQSVNKTSFAETDVRDLYIALTQWH
jgi:hypothetical protein